MLARMGVERVSAVGDIAVRMGEIAVSSTRGDVLVSLGLGSCIGLALVDQRRGIAGLAHVMLPEAIPGGGPAGKFADLAVPALLEQTTALGTTRGALKAVLVGGAQMFSLGTGSAPRHRRPQRDRGPRAARRGAHPGGRIGHRRRRADAPSACVAGGAVLAKRPAVPRSNSCPEYAHEPVPHP